MENYLCIALMSNQGESEADFKRRLSQFWTHMIRNHKEDYERIYAEMVAFEINQTRLTRKYLIESVVAAKLTEELTSQGIAFESIDEDDRYTKFEATPPEWFWIEH